MSSQQRQLRHRDLYAEGSRDGVGTVITMHVQGLHAGNFPCYITLENLVAFRRTQSGRCDIYLS